MPGPEGLRGHPPMVRSVGRGLDPSAGGYPGDGRWREAARGVGDAAPYGLPGNGRRREVAPHPALRGHLPPRGKARAVVEGFIPPGMFAATRTPAGRRGRRPLRLAREREAAGEVAAGWGAWRRTTSGPYKQFLCKHRRGGIYAARGVCAGIRSRAAAR